MTLLSLQGVSKTYPGVIAASAVDFEVCAGEIVGLVGKNGAGKSTIIRIMAGVERPDKGQLRVGGNTVQLHNAAEATRAGIAVVHQELGDIATLSVAENILLGLGYPKQLGMIDRKRLYARARSALDAMHLTIDVNIPVGQLSIAQRRLVMIARGIAAHARVLVLDEPTASLTDTEIAELFAAIRTLQAGGVGVVYVSHRLSEVLELTTRVSVMRDGELIGNRMTAELTESSLIALISGQPERQADVADRPGPRRGQISLQVDGLVPLPGRPRMSLRAHHGEILGLAGLAGSGRSEILRQIMGADPVLSLRHRVNGKSVDIRNPRDAWRHGIALVPEDRRTQGAILPFTLAGNLTLSSLPRHRLSRYLNWPSRRKENLAARRYIDSLKIKADGGDAVIRTLSGGNQQKVILARCLAAEAGILLLDEPTHGVDVDAKEEIYSLIRALAAAGKTIIVVSSELKELTGLVDRALVLRDGFLVATLDGDEVSEDSVLQHCFAAGAA